MDLQTGGRIRTDSWPTASCPVEFLLRQLDFAVKLLMVEFFILIFKNPPVARLSSCSVNSIFPSFVVWVRLSRREDVVLMGPSRLVGLRGNTRRPIRRTRTVIVVTQERES